LGASVLFVALSSGLAVISANRQTDQADSRAARAEAKVAEADAVNVCRNRLAAVLADANTTYSFATGQLVGAQGELLVLLGIGGDATKALADISAGHTAQNTAQTALNEATDARVLFEQHPSGQCAAPIGVTERPVTTTTLPTATTTPRQTRRVTTTTTGHTVTTATTTFHSTPTTTPTPKTTILPQQICGLLPNGMIPCL
jgi:hypothetical protein